MSDNKTLGALMLKELEAEAIATRKCLERIPLDKPDWKPHEKSMPFGYLTTLVAEIPEWVRLIVETGEIDLARFEHFEGKTAAEMTAYFDKNMEGARKALSAITDDALDGQFQLKANGQLLATDTKKDTVFSTINHWVHHRGQLTVYMRLNDIPVPSIYGPSADEQSF